MLIVKRANSLTKNYQEMKFPVLFFLTFLALSCNKPAPKTIVGETSESDVTEAKKEVPTYKQDGDTIQLLSENEKGIFTAEGNIDSLHPRIYVKFDNGTATHVMASVKPVARLGNIRFNQIVFPDKTSDGPFGQDLKLDLNQKGEHTLVIGHSMMAEDPYNGKFDVTLQLTK